MIFKIQLNNSEEEEGGREGEEEGGVFVFVLLFFFLYYRFANKNKDIFKGIFLNWHSKLVFSVFKINCKCSCVNDDPNKF